MTDVGVTLDDLVHRVERAAPSPAPLDALAAAVETAHHLDELGDNLVGHFVDQARTAGLSWAQIGSVLGVTKQAAQQRFVPPPEPDLGRYTERARTVVASAGRHARRLGHSYIGTEHLLMALCDDGDSLASRAMRDLGAKPEKVLAALAEVLPEGTPLGATAPVPYTPRARRIFDLTVREALRLGHNYVGTEHQLLALLAEQDGVAGQVLRQLGLDLDSTRRKVIELLTRRWRG